MTLSRNQIRFLRARGQGLKPVVWVGQHGLSDNVLAEIDSALEAHELIKLKLRVGDRDERKAAFESLCETLHAEPVQTIGNTALIYRRRRQKPTLELPAS